MNKEGITSSIAQRIKDEYRKHSHSIEEWAEIAAHKIYATFDIKLASEVSEKKNDDEWDEVIDKIKEINGGKYDIKLDMELLCLLKENFMAPKSKHK